MNVSRKNKYIKALTRRCNAFISLLLCIALTGSLFCLPAFAVPETGAQSTPKSSGTQLYGADKSELSPVGNSGVTVKDGDDTDYVFVRDLSDISVGYFKSCFRNKASQIKVFRDGAELADTDLLSTDCTVECVSSVDSSVVYETAKAVVFCDVDGDGGFDDDDITAIMNKAVTGTDDLITDGSAYFEAADCTEDGVVDGFDISVADLVLSQSKNCINFEKVNYNEFITKFEHTDKYLYRVGNGNTVKLGSLFGVSKAGDSPVVSANVNIGAYSIDGETSVCGTVNNSNLVSDSTAKCVYTRNASDWTHSTLKFTGEGPVELSISDGDGRVCYLNLEVVNANNATTAVSATSANIVLLNDVPTSSISITNNHILYGNGFKVTDTRNHPSQTEGFVRISSGSADNVMFIGYEASTAVTGGVNNADYAPGIRIKGEASLYNCYVSGARNAILVEAGQNTVYLKNTVLDGGAISGMEVASGTVVLEDCITTESTRGGLKGLAIKVSDINAKLYIKGTFKQYNWLQKSDLPSNYSSAFGSLYSDNTYAYTVNGKTYVNIGVMFLSDATNFSSAQAQAIVHDTTSNNYGYFEKTMFNYTGTGYIPKATEGSPDMLSMPEYEPSEQYYTQPDYSFDFTSKNYIAMTAGDNNYCYYDSTTGKVNLSFDKTDSSSSFDWDTDILSVSKYGQPIDYTVTMNGDDYTGRDISFSESGDYEVVYTYTDGRNFDKDCNAFSHTYTKTVNISVSAVEPDDSTYYASFSYDGAAGNYAAKKVIGTDNKIYVMPDVSSTSSTIGSTTVAGQTVYYPIVNVGPTSSNGNSAYSSGKGYYFAPVFSELHIIDYNQETGATQYEYSKNTTTWPRGKSATSGPNTDYFTCASGEKVYSATSPYARAMNAQYYKYGKNNLGVCYTSEDIEKDNAASQHLVEYHYVSTDGNTYYYYIKYNFTKMTYSSCVTEGTLVTMADGTKKPIEQVNQGDMVMTWSLWNGCYEAQPVTMKWYHGTQNWEVLTLNFSDGTSVRMINQHGFFDADENTYAYIKPGNVDDYIGHRFIKQNADGTNETVTLTDYTLEEENVGCYSLQTAYNESFMVEDMLSMTGEDYDGRFEYFDIGDGMKYDEEKMQADIDRYGLYTYEEFSDYLTPMQFELFNGKYFKVLVGKGVLTYDDILGIIRDNL